MAHPARPLYLLILRGDIETHVVQVQRGWVAHFGRLREKVGAPFPPSPFMASRLPHTKRLRAHTAASTPTARRGVLDVSESALRRLIRSAELPAVKVNGCTRVLSQTFSGMSRPLPSRRAPVGKRPRRAEGEDTGPRLLPGADLDESRLAQEQRRRRRSRASARQRRRRGASGDGAAPSYRPRECRGTELEEDRISAGTVHHGSCDESDAAAGD